MAPELGWVWHPAERNQGFRHPADVPFENVALAKSAFLEGFRGPRLARISKVDILEDRPGNRCLIAERGETREVCRSMTIHFGEGLLLLQELEQMRGQPGHLEASWFNDELKGILNKALGKWNTRRLSGTGYVDSMLLRSAVTGQKVTDIDGNEHSYRRHIKEHERLDLVKGENEGSFFRMKDIIGYIPPWEAFHDARCGFYQDFYLVRWEHSSSQVDCAATENGSAEEPGASWEPDECVPACLDALRLAAKTNWVKACRAREAQVKAVRRTPTVSPIGMAALGMAVRRTPTMSPLGMSSRGTPPPAAAAVRIKRERPLDVPAPPPAKLARKRRDDLPLERDVVHSSIGHDFAPEALGEFALSQIRIGWPTKAEEYPPGFSTASPPGFCLTTCDCMEDNRIQKPGETVKDWLEKAPEGAARAAAAEAAVAMFAQHGQLLNFLMRRGSVSKQHFLQPAQQGRLPEQTGETAAAHLAASINRAMKAVLGDVPVGCLIGAETVRFPCRTFLPESVDYEPLRIFASPRRLGARMPDWIRINPDDGQIAVSRQPSAFELPLRLRLEFDAAEGPIAADGGEGRGIAISADVAVVVRAAAPAGAPWTLATAKLAQLYSECALERGVRAGLHDHFDKIYDFNMRSPRLMSLGKWLEVVYRISRLLSVAASGSLALDHPNGLGASGIPGPRTPTQ
mmetsp:Transcript_78617/g.254130  ORF Transcript_78617/g.254130 Transcript_78617/m.254130 type:complete len:686 (+) Transcript_78617:105-2162(+)